MKDTTSIPDGDFRPASGLEPRHPEPQERAFARPGVTPKEENDQLTALFEEAWNRNPGLRHEEWFTFADYPARIRIVGHGLAKDVFRAFQHLARSGEAPDPALYINLWDQKETGLGIDGLRPSEDLNAQGETYVSEDGHVVVTARPQTRTAFQRVERIMVGWVADHGHLTQYEIGRPLHSEMMLWHKDRDVQAIHAGFVSRNGDGVLFGGPGGAGKSTTALTCLKAGFEYMGDDYVGLKALGGGEYEGHSLFCSTHLEPKHLKRFPYLKEFAIPGRLPREDKSLVLLSEVLPGGLSR
ncbi:MAG: hypothetical protein PVJ76_21360, partial [Gemmatimonadota bacterium]